MRKADRFEFLSRLFWTGLLVAAASAHLLMPDWFAAYYPSYLPLAKEAIAVSAVVEIMIASALWCTPARRIAWFALAVLMMLYMPVHMYVITHHGSIAHPTLSVPLWLAWLRLPVQVVFVIWPLRIGLRCGV